MNEMEKARYAKLTEKLGDEEMDELIHLIDERIKKADDKAARDERIFGRK